MEDASARARREQAEGEGASRQPPGRERRGSTRGSTEIQKKLDKLLDDADHLATLRQSELAVIMESFRNTAWEIELAARKVRANPAVLIFGDDEKKRLEADPRDDSGLRKSGRVKPYEKRDETPAKKE